MSDPKLKEHLLSKASVSYLSLTQQVNHMLDVCHEYCSVPDEKLSLPESHRVEDVRATFKPIASAVTQLGDVIRRWRHNEPRILSRLGVEVTLLNELALQLNCLHMFLLFEGAELHPYNRLKAEQAITELVDLNQRLD